MTSSIPELLFIGAGNIAQSIIKGILKPQPEGKNHILVTAPSQKNLNYLEKELGCQVVQLGAASDLFQNYKPQFVFLCVKPQVLHRAAQNPDDQLNILLKRLPEGCITLSVVAGVDISFISGCLKDRKMQVVRVMLNTASQLGSSSILYYADSSQISEIESMEILFASLGQPVVQLGHESLLDVATGICGSGIAFFYEMIQATSDVAVKNGIGRADATLIAAQLAKAAGEMVLNTHSHPYQLRDKVSSPAGTTIYGLQSWHDSVVNQRVGQAFQAAIDRATDLSAQARK